MRASRWGGAAPATEEECRRLLLKAAARCFESRGPLGVTVDDIARLASVHRTTVYKYFPNRDAIISGLLMWDADHLIAGSAAKLRSAEPFAERFVQAVAHIIDGVHESKLLRSLFDPDIIDFVARATTASEEFRAQVATSLGVAVAEAAERGEIRAGLEVDEVVDWLSYVAILLIGESFREDGPDVVAALRKFVLPGVCSAPSST